MRRLAPGLVAALVFALCGSGPGSAAAADPPEAGAADRAAIAAASRAFSDAYVRNDSRAIAELYTEDAVLLPPGGEFRGREAAARYFAWGPGRRQVAHAMESSELVVAGDMAVDVGTWHSTSQRGDAPPVTASGRYLVVWVRQGDGAWRMRYDMWHRPSGPPEPERAESGAE